MSYDNSDLKGITFNSVKSVDPVSGSLSFHDEDAPLTMTQRYQQGCKSTAIYPSDRGLEYLALGLTSEAGEVAGKVKKYIRDGGALPVEALQAELGDVMWYIAMLATELNLDLGGVMEANLHKLSMRAQRGSLKGSGDER